MKLDWFLEVRLGTNVTPDSKKIIGVCARTIFVDRVSKKPSIPQPTTMKQRKCHNLNSVEDAASRKMRGLLALVVLAPALGVKTMAEVRLGAVEEPV